MKMHICKSPSFRMLAGIVSYFAFLLLIMPPSTEGIIRTVLLFGLGTGLILWKKPYQNGFPRPFSLLALVSLILSVILLIIIGIDFFNEWRTSSKVRAIAAVLHMPHHILTAITTVCLVFCAFFFLYWLFHTAYNLKYKNLLARDLVFLTTMSAAVVSLSQRMIDTSIFSMGLLKWILGFILVSVVILAFYCLTGRIIVSVVLGTILFMVISTINVYVYAFRGRLFEPVDIFSTTAVLNVIDNYSLFPIPTNIIIGWGIYILLLIGMFKCCWKTKYSMSVKNRLILALCCLIGLGSVIGYAHHLKPEHWKNNGTKRNGYILDFAAKFKEIRIAKPDDYNSAFIDEIAKQYIPADDHAAAEKKSPHILVIMDESFSDLSMIGEISTDTEIMPFISSLKQNTVFGYAQASIHGGNTANSEYEFLTGNSMAWMSPNSVPYQQYIKAPAYSMVSYLKSYDDYRCVAMHPYHANGWNRPFTYAHLGFDEMFFLEDFPQKQLIRNYVSDQEMFETMVDMYENSHQEPLFLFGVSMQNHGNFAYSGENYTQSVSLVGYDQEYPDVEQYLSLLHETDKAVEYLISYFQNADDDVVIVFFGDHQPKISENFYEKTAGHNFASLEEQQDKYIVPFFIWTNYDIDAQYIERTSLNYLSSYVYETAGIPLPPYNRFLSEMEEIIPVINSLGFYSAASQKYLPFDQASDAEKAWLQLYEQLQYNNAADKKHRNDTLFPLPD